MFSIIKSWHTNMWFTSVNFQLAMVRTQACGVIIHTQLEAIKCHIVDGNSPVMRASNFDGK